MKLFINVQQDSKVGDKLVDSAKWRMDLDTEAKTVTTLLTDLKNRVAIDTTKYTISDEKVLSEGVEAKKTDKVETLKQIGYSFVVTKI